MVDLEVRGNNMALLTEEQIKEIDTMRFRFNEHHFKYELEKWSEKQQPSTQFEQDWSKAPEKAVQAVVNSSWVDKNGDTFGVYKTYYDRSAPVITPHPHADIMAKYAEVAARRVDPWIELELYSEPFDDWVTLETPTFFDTLLKYRHIGDEK